MKNKNNNVLGNLTEINNGKVVTNRNKQNNITKVTKKIPDKKKQPSKEAIRRAICTAHEEIENLKLSETSPQTPRETLKRLYDNGCIYIENVSFFVKGFLKDSNETMVTVENVCSTKLLTYHCQLVVEDNPGIVDCIGKLVTCDIEIYPYPENPDKLSFNIIGDIICENPNWYVGVGFCLKIDRQFRIDSNMYLSSMLKTSKEFKVRFINTLITDINYMSSVLYGNEHLISNLIFNTLMVSLDVDDRIIYENEAFINKYFYDITMIYTKIYIDVIKNDIKFYSDLKEEVLKIVGIYTDSPYVNKGKITQEFLNTCTYFNISNKQAKFYYNLFDLTDKTSYSLDERREILNGMKDLVVDYSYTI